MLCYFVVLCTILFCKSLAASPYAYSHSAAPVTDVILQEAFGYASNDDRLIHEYDVSGDNWLDQDELATAVYVAQHAILFRRFFLIIFGAFVWATVTIYTLRSVMTKWHAILCNLASIAFVTIINRWIVSSWAPVVGIMLLQIPTAGLCVMVLLKYFRKVLQTIVLICRMYQNINVKNSKLACTQSSEKQSLLRVEHKTANSFKNSQEPDALRSGLNPYSELEATILSDTDNEQDVDMKMGDLTNGDYSAIHYNISDDNLAIDKSNVSEDKNHATCASAKSNCTNDSKKRFHNMFEAPKMHSTPRPDVNAPKFEQSTQNDAAKLNSSPYSRTICSNIVSEAQAFSERNDASIFGSSITVADRGFPSDVNQSSPSLHVNRHHSDDFLFFEEPNKSVIFGLESSVGSSLDTKGTPIFAGPKMYANTSGKIARRRAPPTADALESLAM